MRIRVSGHWPLVGLLSLLPLALAARVVDPRPRPAAPVRYWVSFADKAGVAFNPATYFSPAAQARRRRQGLPAKGQRGLGWPFADAPAGSRWH
jgi:hypothetical protein